MGNCNKNILILTYWSYNDALIQTYTLPYVKLIANNLGYDNKLFLLTLEKQGSPEIHTQGKINFISRIYRPPGIRAALEWIVTIYRLAKIIKKNNISVIHAWCTPAGMIGYILAVLTGKELIIDSFEPHAEAMVENGEWRKNSLIFKLLFRFEKLQAHRAKYLIAISSKMKAYAEDKYNYKGNNYFIKPACVNLELFSENSIKNENLLAKFGLKDKIVCVYAGKFGGIYLDQEVFDFFKAAKEEWGEKFKVLLLTAESDDVIENLCHKSGFNPSAIVKLFVPHEQIPVYMGLGDFAITPVKPIPTKRCCSPIKNGEYWALGLPVVITKDISDDSDIISNSEIGSVLKSLDNVSYKMAISQIRKLLETEDRKMLYTKIRKIAEEHRNFKIAESIYSEIYC